MVVAIKLSTNSWGILRVVILHVVRIGNDKGTFSVTKCACVSPKNPCKNPWTLHICLIGVNKPPFLFSFFRVSSEFLESLLVHTLFPLCSHFVPTLFPRARFVAFVSLARFGSSRSRSHLRQPSTGLSWLSWPSGPSLSCASSRPLWRSSRPCASSTSCRSSRQGPQGPQGPQGQEETQGKAQVSKVRQERVKRGKRGKRESASEREGPQVLKGSPAAHALLPYSAPCLSPSPRCPRHCRRPSRRRSLSRLASARSSKVSTTGWRAAHTLPLAGSLRISWLSAPSLVHASSALRSNHRCRSSPVFLLSAKERGYHRLSEADKDCDSERSESEER